MKMQYAPIALFTYNRADHTKQAVESLLKNAEAKYSDLFIFSDGPKNEKARKGVEENREYIQSLKNDNDTLALRYADATITPYFRSVTIIEREKNWGLANSLIAGITEIVNKYGRVIVVEDDLVLSPYFLKFMNDALEKYEDDDRVGAVSAFIYPITEKLPETFFMRYFHCWGWATWKRGWNLLNTNTKYLLRKMRFKKNDFDIGGAYGNLYCTKIGLVDSWWVRLYASFYLAGKLTLYPGKSLVSNIGVDGSGTHSKNHSEDKDQYVYISYDKPILIEDIPVKENTEALRATMGYFEKKNNSSPVIKKFAIIKSFIRRLFYVDCR